MSYISGIGSSSLTGSNDDCLLSYSQKPMLIDGTELMLSELWCVLMNKRVCFVSLLGLRIDVDNTI